jgi:hypothetical protein
MLKRLPIQVAAVVLLSLAFAGAADAEPLAFNFTYIADELILHDPQAGSLLGFNVGDIGSGTIVLESSTPDRFSTDEARSFYIGALRSVTLTFGSVTFEAGDFSSSSLGISNDIQNGPGFSDSLSLQGMSAREFAGPAGFGLDNFYVNLQNFFLTLPVSPLTSDQIADLPASFPNSEWNSEHTFNFVLSKDGRDYGAALASIQSATLAPVNSVPEPSSVILLSFGTGALGMFANRRKEKPTTNN